MAAERKGIAVAGSVILDKINEISAYPAAGQLTQISGLSKAIGGCVPNVALDLKKICPHMPIRAIGKIGEDAEGEYVVQVLSEGGVDTTGLVKAAGQATSFTDVMSIPGGQRTFFTYPGASADFGCDDIDWDNLDSKMLHLGYFLLLQKVDDGDGLEILKKASDAGITTSIDLVTENSDRYELVLPCLPYTDHLIINEAEAGKLTGIAPEAANLEAMAKALKAMGVRKTVVIHMPELAVCLSDAGCTLLPSYDLPKGYIKGTTGAGDAFCAGALVGLYEGWDDLHILEFASACAVMALGAADATSGLKTQEEIVAFCSQFGRKA